VSASVYGHFGTSRIRPWVKVSGRVKVKFSAAVLKIEFRSVRCYNTGNSAVVCAAYLLHLQNFCGPKIARQPEIPPLHGLIIATAAKNSAAVLCVIAATADFLQSKQNPAPTVDFSPVHGVEIAISVE